MKLRIDVPGGGAEVDVSAAIDISIRLDFHGLQPNVYGLPLARAKACEERTFIGDTRRGGHVNCEQYTVTPHGNGTHTECVGHLTRERISIANTLRRSLFPCTLTSITPTPAASTKETYDPPKQRTDLLITKEALTRALRQRDPFFLQAIVLRTLPNDAQKKTAMYGDSPVAFFSLEAMHYLNSLSVEHLLIDLPSVDRLQDEGKLAGHRLYWNVDPGAKDVEEPCTKTITELIFVPESVQDGYYLLELQIPSFIADAAPSRPFLYELRFYR